MVSPPSSDPVIQRWARELEAVSVRMGYADSDRRWGPRQATGMVVEVAHDADWIASRAEGSAPGCWAVDKDVGEW